MKFDDQGLPVGFLTRTATIIAGPNLEGNLLTLGNRSSVRGLVLQGAPPPPEGNAGHVPEADARPVGNVVAVASRGQDDIVSAAIDECVLINENDSGVGPDAPTGAAVLVHTGNPKLGEAPPPHEDAEVTVDVTQSIVEAAKDGKAVFAMNFASGGKVTIKLKKNDIRGPLDVIGGLSRPDAVVGATTTIISRANRYSGSGSDAAAWQVFGGSSPPFEAGPNSNSDSNTANVESRDDEIKGFQVGIVAFGGLRLNSDGGTCSYNEVNLKLLRMTIATRPPVATKPPEAAADFVFVGAQSAGPFSAGDANIVHVHMQQSTGSGRRENLYADSAGFGTGNQLVFKGTTVAFTRNNRRIDPAPPAEFFEHGG